MLLLSSCDCHSVHRDTIPAWPAVKRELFTKSTVGLPLSQPDGLNYLVPTSQTLLFADPRPLVERLGQDFFRQLTERSGVYLMRDAQDNILYVGKAKNLKKRLNSYRVANSDRLPRRHLRLLRAVARIELQECADEAAALAKEAELLLSLKPKFNRAGTWPAKPRFLIWQGDGTQLALAISETPAEGWQAFGPFGSGILHLRAALLRLLWFALNPAAGSAAMPAGWAHGRLGEIATVSDGRSLESDFRRIDVVLAELFAGDNDGFIAWVGEQTKPLARAHDLAMRDADLEMVIQFMQAKARRTRPFTVPEPSTTEQQMDAIELFADVDGNHP
ncbi:MAG: GIY-YIG nuclease family protein [Verrucomicrobiota bacterium]